MLMLMMMMMNVIMSEHDDDVDDANDELDNERHDAHADMNLACYYYYDMITMMSFDRLVNILWITLRILLIET